MARPLRISLFMPRRNRWYESMLQQMLRGFRRAGFHASGTCALLSAPQLQAWCRDHRPDALLEMNRCRADLPQLPRGVLHLAWIVDFNGRRLGDFHGSDVTYLFGQRWLPQYPYRSSFFKWLGPGACPRAYRRVRGGPRRGVSLVGHIPRPWSADELARNVTAGAANFRFGDLLPPLETRLAAQRDTLVSHDDYMLLADAVCRASCGHGFVPDPVLGYDVSGRLIRLMNRRELVDRVVDCTGSLRLYGPDNWACWPRYRPYYRRFLHSPEQMRRVYRGSLVNLHEGNGIHFRSMDCMMAGGLLFYRGREVDEQPGGIRTLFEPGRHYVSFDIGELGEKLDYYLGHPQEAARVADNAAARMRAAHSWRHRALEIRADLERVYGY